MTIEELGTLMAGEFSRMHERFDRLELRVMRLEEICEDLVGRMIGIEDRLSRVEYRVEEVERTFKDSPPKMLKKRIQKLEKRTFGAVQPA